jgi:hypothetical protein
MSSAHIRALNSPGVNPSQATQKPMSKVKMRYLFGNGAKPLRLTPEPKRIAVGIITRQGKLSPAAEKFCQCAKEAFSSWH